MRILTIDSGPPNDATVICRQSRFVSVAAAAVFVVLLVGVPTAMWMAGHLPAIVAMGISLIALIILPLVCGDAQAALLRSNWVFAYGPGGVWLNLRSYRNHRLEQADTVVHLSFDELQCAGQEVVRRSEDMGDGKVTWREFSLWLQLPNANIVRLSEAIASERNRKSVTKLLGGLITTSGRSNHDPVRVSPTGLVRIMWRSRYDLVRPGLGDVLNGLSKYVQVETASSQIDEQDWRTLSDQQFDDRIVNLVETGETIAAVKLLKLRRGFSVTEAKKFVDELTEGSQKAPPHTPVM